MGVLCYNLGWFIDNCGIIPCWPPEILIRDVYMIKNPHGEIFADFYVVGLQIRYKLHFALNLFSYICNTTCVMIIVGSELCHIILSCSFIQTIDANSKMHFSCHFIDRSWTNSLAPTQVAMSVWPTLAQPILLSWMTNRKTNFDVEFVPVIWNMLPNRLGFSHAKILSSPCVLHYRSKVWTFSVLNNSMNAVILLRLLMLVKASHTGVDHSDLLINSVPFNVPCCRHRSSES